jgi:lipopolysaccharide export system protein LptA
MIRNSMLLAAGLALMFVTAPVQAQTVDTKDAKAEADQPKDVDIEADQMQILDEQKKAIFKGNVIGKRGNVTLTCTTLTVDYVETPNTPPATGSKTEVTLLDAQGNVKIVTKTQTITGNAGKMDVKANQVTVTGQVKVVQGKTVITGEKLFADLDTGKSEMTGGRVKGSFVPQQ